MALIEIASKRPDAAARVAVVIPCFRAEHSIAEVVASVPAFVSMIICVDDCSDDGQAQVLRRLSEEQSRVHVVTHTQNQGVGGATVSGYRRALELDAEVLVKIDADGQMDPDFIVPLIAPILEGEADYAKGNRFFDLEEVRCMPTVRLVGNAGLSLITKLTTGYWDLFDPTNGFTAIHANVARILPLHRLHKRYFFESDLLFRLSLVRARIVDVPMVPIYGDEISNMSASRTLLTFPFLHGRNMLKRIVYNYYLRGFSAASLSLLVGLPLVLFGVIFGVLSWMESAATGNPATAGTVMLSSLPLLVGFQLLLHFMQHDVASVPKVSIQKRVQRLSALKSKPKTERAEAAPAPAPDWLAQKSLG
jgi:glycosyltransferase involved in cell wall biosynthesis